LGILRPCFSDLIFKNYVKNGDSTGSRVTFLNSTLKILSVALLSIEQIEVSFYTFTIFKTLGGEEWKK